MFDPSLVVLSAFLVPSSAQNSSDPSRVGWKSGPSERGTMEIVWTCLATMFTCTWVCLHLNVPSTHDGWWTDFGRKLKWMLIMILAPEYVATTALAQRSIARASVKRVKQWYNDHKSDIEKGGGAENDDGREYVEGETLEGGGTEDQAGVQMSDEHAGVKDGHVRGSHVSVEIVEDQPEWTMTHAFFVGMGGLTCKFAGNEIKTLNTDDLLFLVDEGYVEFPKITQKDIEDRSKADGLVKALACIQISWLVVECVGRFIAGLPISEIELATCAFVSCTLPVYGAWWNKPKDVQAPIRIDLRPGRYPPRLPEVPRRKIRLAAAKRERALNDTMLTFADTRRARVGLFGILFNAIHCAAWKFSFPTTTERTLWRICSVTATAIPAAIGLVWLVVLRNFDRTDDPWTLPRLYGRLRVWFTYLCAPVYTVARLIILVQIFLCLRSMPSDIYQRLSWGDYIPHI